MLLKTLVLYLGSLVENNGDLPALERDSTDERYISTLGTVDLMATGSEAATLIIP